MPAIPELVRARQMHADLMLEPAFCEAQAEASRLDEELRAVQMRIGAMLLPSQRANREAGELQMRSLTKWLKGAREPSYERCRLLASGPNGRFGADAWLRQMGGYIGAKGHERYWTLDIKPATAAQRFCSVLMSSVVLNADDASKWESREALHTALLAASDALLERAGYILTDLENEPESTP